MLSIELVTFAVDFYLLVVEFGAFAVEFISFTVHFIALALQFVTLEIELDAFAIELGAFALEFVMADCKKLSTCHEVKESNMKAVVEILRNELNWQSLHCTAHCLQLYILAGLQNHYH